MKIKKLHIEIFFNYVKGTEGILSLSEARMRDMFLNKLLEPLQTYIQDRDKIYKEFCIKDNEGNPDLLDGTKYQFDKDKIDEINKELIELNDEEIEIEIPSILSLSKLKEILEKSEYKPK